MTQLQASIRTGRRGPPVHQTVAALLQDVFRDEARTVIVAVGGPGGTGKTTFAARLAAALGDACVLRLDDYKVNRAERARRQVYGAHPEANRMTLIERHLAEIRQGRGCDKPIYERAGGTTDATEPFLPRRFVIAEGEVATYRPFRPYVDFAVFIDSDWRTQLEARLGRDLTRRNYSPEKAVATFLHSNLREFGRFGAESRQWAHLHLHCDADWRLTIQSVAPAFRSALQGCAGHEADAVHLEGVAVSLLTPFDRDEAVDGRAFVAHLEFLAAHGLRRVVVGAETGEFWALAGDERLQLLKLAVDHFPGLVMYHVSCWSLQETLAQARRAEQLGADALLCLPPLFPAGADGVRHYLQRVAEATDTPLLIYNHPGLTPNRVNAALLESVGCDGLLDAAPHAELQGRVATHLVDEERLEDAAAGGAFAGICSSRANVHPELYATAAGDAATRAQPTGASSIPQLKQALAARLSGYRPVVRLPLVAADRCAPEAAGRKPPSVHPSTGAFPPA